MRDQIKDLKEKIQYEKYAHNSKKIMVIDRKTCGQEK